MGMVNSYDDLKAHIGHRVECVQYASGVNVALECLDCNHVLVDYNRPDVDQALDRATKEQNEKLAEQVRKEGTKETLISEILDHLAGGLLYPAPRQTNLYMLNKTTLAVLVLALR